MTAFQWPSLNVRDANPQPGAYILNGSEFSNVGFFAANVGAGAENTGLDVEHWPYDRIIFVPRIGDDFANTLGTLWYHRNVIWERQTGTGNWITAHSVLNQSGSKDFGVHTGLYYLFGRDNRAYVCGIYAGSVATEVGGVVYDVENGTWSSFTQDVGTQFTACTVAFQHRGFLWLSTQGTTYRLDPVNQQFQTLSTPNSDPRDKFFSLGNRLFVASKSGTSIQIYEVVGFSYSSLLVSATGVSINTSGDFGILRQFDAAYLIFHAGTLQYDVWELQTSSTVPGTGISIVDRTSTAAPVVIGTTNADNVVYVAHDADSAPALNIQPRIYLMEVSGAGDPYSKVKAAYGWNGPLNPISRVAVSPNNVQANVAYTSAHFGLADTIYWNDNKIVVYKLESAESVVAGGVRIYFWMFGASSPLSIRLYYNDITDVNNVKVPDQPATLAAFSSGTYDAGQKRLDGLVNGNTGVAHNIVWDRIADVGSRLNTVSLNILMNSPGTIPVI